MLAFRDSSLSTPLRWNAVSVRIAHHRLVIIHFLTACSFVVVFELAFIHDGTIRFFRLVCHPGSRGLIKEFRSKFGHRGDGMDTQPTVNFCLLCPGVAVRLRKKLIGPNPKTDSAVPFFLPSFFPSFFPSFLPFLPFLPSFPTCPPSLLSRPA